MKNTAKIKLKNRIRKLLSDKRGFFSWGAAGGDRYPAACKSGYDAGNGFCHPDV